MILKAFSKPDHCHRSGRRRSFIFGLALSIVSTAFTSVGEATNSCNQALGSRKEPVQSISERTYQDFKSAFSGAVIPMKGVRGRYSQARYGLRRITFFVNTFRSSPDSEGSGSFEVDLKPSLRDLKYKAPLAPQDADAILYRIPSTNDSTERIVLKFDRTRVTLKDQDGKPLLRTTRYVGYLTTPDGIKTLVLNVHQENHGLGHWRYKDANLKSVSSTRKAEQNPEDQDSYGEHF